VEVEEAGEGHGRRSWRRPEEVMAIEGGGGQRRSWPSEGEEAGGGRDRRCRRRPRSTVQQLETSVGVEKEEVDGAAQPEEIVGVEEEEGEEENEKRRKRGK
jgi:hypothetical protein